MLSVFTKQDPSSGRGMWCPEVGGPSGCGELDEGAYVFLRTSRGLLNLLFEVCPTLPPSLALLQLLDMPPAFQEAGCPVKAAGSGFHQPHDRD